MQRKRKSRKTGSSSTLSLLRKELRDGDLQRLLGISSRNGSSGTPPDPLLSSFISPTLSSHLFPVTRQPEKVSDEKQIERYVAFYVFSFSFYNF